MSLSRRTVLAAALTLPATHAFAAPPLEVSGKFIQGGAVIGKTAPRAAFSVDGEIRGTASDAGYFVVGYDRDAPGSTRIAVTTPEGTAVHEAQVAKADYDIQRIDGLPQSTVTPQGDELLARIAAEAERKAEGFASNVDADWFTTGFQPPLDNYRISGRFGGQRILNGVPNRPHYGADMAAPRGTPIKAPAGGLVSFAETGLHYEGGLIMIDHGQGLISAYLHMSRVSVAKGERVHAGHVIGNVGAEGRATGPHLCWRMKWHGRNLDPTLFVGVQAPS